MPISLYHSSLKSATVFVKFLTDAYTDCENKCKYIGERETKTVEYTLWELKENETGTIISLAEDRNGLSKRLMDLGFTPGCAVTCIRISPLGNPAAYRIRGTLIALRKKDAALIIIKPRIPFAP